VGTAPLIMLWRHPWNARNQYPLLFIDQEPESRCQDEHKLYVANDGNLRPGRSNNGWLMSRHGKRKKVILMVQLMMVTPFTSIERQLMINMRLISVLLYPKYQR
jgi:hypothetical protein